MTGANKGIGLAIVEILYKKFSGDIYLTGTFIIIADWSHGKSYIIMWCGDVAVEGWGWWSRWYMMFGHSIIIKDIPWSSCNYTVLKNNNNYKLQNMRTFSSCTDIGVVVKKGGCAIIMPSPSRKTHYLHHIVYNTSYYYVIIIIIMLWCT